MAVLSAENRALASKLYQMEISTLREGHSLFKSDLRAAIDALDVFLDNNAAAINAAIPPPARTLLTVKQKARLLVYVIRQRYEVA